MPETERPTSRELYEFGPFRVDVEKETLQCSGEPVALTPKTFQILLVLVRHSQEIVTKDDLLKTVWPDTFVEEGNLSRNIFMLRKALGESSKDHRYILTVPGRGYRLAEKVHLLPGQEVSIVAPTHSRVEVELAETKPWGWIAAAAALTIVLAAAGMWVIANRKPALTAKNTVVVSEFANNTGDPVFSGSLRQGLAVQLEQSPFLNLISDQRIEQGLKMMGQPANARLTPVLALDLCRRVGGSAVLEGSIASLGSHYVLDLRATDCREGKVLAQEQVQTARKEDVLNALSGMATNLRKRLGESLLTVEQHNTPLADATTPSLEALKAYSTALKAHQSVYPIYVRGEAYLAAHNGAAAAAEFEKILGHRGITVSDPIGPLARLQLGRAYLMTGQRERAKSEYERFLMLWVDADPNIPVLKQAKVEYGKLI